ncbi:glycerol-3-phosphate 1-O-acyltransferase PlsY [Gemmatimonas groenlandica]|uniref:Glycerol-3-phosphate acyltransferase n=1 Tax=Gemmatimonas groenlandica TaxID=2732249 RepID=A0A6M4INN4_9BACT|nr:glycerol-3-phosphate 1-O-acyltransferase PlsY [Gemmatimonas groenlandica]QJR35097.1 glycerol-3-phosphate 1-O-acyltransferase PlsY [Gemmatimonas groenlandica]
MIAQVAALLAAYVIGSFPTAYLVGKANGVDLRTVGSGNLGATNVFRTLGWKWGLLVYIVDGLKGALPVLLLPGAIGVATGWPWGAAFGLLAILGHVRPVFLMGKGGGKGVATASGVFIALAPIPALCAIVGFAIAVAMTRYVSLGSLVGAVVLPVALLLQQREVTPLVLLSAAVGAFVFWTHRENIGRLRRGEERRVGSSSSSSAGGRAS